MLLTPEDIKEITDARLRASRADACIVDVSGGDSLNMRFARNSATSNGAQSEVSVTITSQFGKRQGSATVTSLEADVLAEAQARSEDIARLAPVDIELMPPLGPQQYAAAGAAYDDATTQVRAADLAVAAKSVIEHAVEANVDATGYAEVSMAFLAKATSAGLFAYDRETATRFSATARNKAGTWSGWAGASEFRFDRLDAGPLARRADEGRSFMSRKGGGTKLGEKLFDTKVTIYSDPQDTTVPATSYSYDGLPHGRTVWVEDGVVRNLHCSRFWAQQMGRDPLPIPGSLVMAGGTTSVEDMIRSTRRGILVTRLWYMNFIDPQTLLLTGLTRDGNFLIENGQIVGPARNLRFNESLAAILSNVVAAGPSERSYGGDSGNSAISAPPLLVDGFTFSSRSSGI